MTRMTAPRNGAWVGLGLTAASAALVALAFPPAGIQPFAWIGLVPLLIALRSGTTRRAAFFAVVWLVLFAALVGQWLPRAVSTYYQQPRWVGFAFFAGITATMGAPYYVAFALVYRQLARRPTIVMPLLVAAAWTAVELARGRLFTGSPVFIGNPWGLLGYSQVGLAPLVQVASVTGIYGVGFVLVAANAAVAEWWLARRGDAATRRTAARSLVVGILPAVLAILFGTIVVQRETGEARDLVPIVVVQGNVDVGSTWRTNLYGSNLNLYLRLTRTALADRAPRIVFWPEGAFTFFLERHDAYRQAIASVLAPAGVELVAGGPSTAGPPDAYWNSIFLVTSRGEIRGRYDKEYLVPFAEFFPLGGVDILRRRFEGARLFVRGTHTGPLETVAGKAGIVTCNEAMLPEVVGTRVADGATYLVNPSNDSWLADEQYSAQQLGIVSMRAVEQRRWLVRASTSGPSAIVDPWGRVVTRSPALAEAVMSGTIAARDDRTVYGRVGDAFAMTCGLAVLVALWRSVAGRRPATR